MHAVRYPKQTTQSKSRGFSGWWQCWEFTHDGQGAHVAEWKCWHIACWSNNEHNYTMLAAVRYTNCYLSQWWMTCCHAPLCANLVYWAWHHLCALSLSRRKGLYFTSCSAGYYFASYAGDFDIWIASFRCAGFNPPLDRFWLTHLLVNHPLVNKYSDQQQIFIDNPLVVIASLAPDDMLVSLRALLLLQIASVIVLQLA